MIPVVLPSLEFKPRYINPPDLNTWIEHLPFAYDLIRSLKPTLVVELGTYYGESFFGFCQAVVESGLDCMCYAVDTWQGDRHAGLYGEDVYDAVAAHQRENYSAFAYLLRTTFDNALSSFENETISLLHIDGLHTYEAVSHDLHRWYPKVRPGGVILLHDIAMRHDDFGVWRFWNDLQRDLPGFAFHHGHGLGVVQKPGSATGDNLVSELLCAGPELQSGARRYYSVCGMRLFTEAHSKPQYTLVRLYWPESGQYSEDRSVYAHIRVNVWETLRLHVPAVIAAGRLRLDPVDAPGIIELSELMVASPSHANPFWSLDLSSMSAVECAGTALRIPTEPNLTIISDGNDPQLLLPEIGAAPDGLVVQVTMRAHTGSAVVSGFIGSLAEAYAGRAISETASNIVYAAVARPPEAVRLLEDLVSRSNEAQEQLKGVRSQLQEAKSQTAHYQNLLEEQRQQAADSRNRHQEAKSQAAHYHNLLEEQRQQAADSANRYQEAKSQAAHYHNLLEEQRQQAADSANRYQEAKSQAAHNQNLLEEQRQRAADSDNRYQEAKSQAAHYQNLLEEQKQRAADFDNRYQEAKSQAAHYQNLLEEQKQPAADFDSRLQMLKISGGPGEQRPLKDTGS